MRIGQLIYENVTINETKKKHNETVKFLNWKKIIPTKKKKLIKFQRYLTKTSTVNRKIDDGIVGLFQLKMISSMRKTKT